MPGGYASARPFDNEKISSYFRAMLNSNTVSRSVLRVALLTAAVLLIPVMGMLFTDEVDWGVFDFVFAAVLLAGVGLLYELALRRPGSFALRAIATVIGVAAIVVGEADDAPGLVLFGGLVIVGTLALAARTSRREGRA
jgi:hypothetical protein